jgi:hypothetical protein
LGAQDWPETRHRLDRCGLMVATERRRSDLLVEALDALIELKKLTASSAMIISATCWPGSSMS